MPRNEMKPFLCQGNEPDGGCLNIEMKSNVLVPRLGVNSELELGPGGAAGDIVTMSHSIHVTHCIYIKSNHINFENGTESLE